MHHRSGQLPFGVRVDASEVLPIAKWSSLTFQHQRVCAFPQSWSFQRGTKPANQVYLSSRRAVGVRFEGPVLLYAVASGKGDTSSASLKTTAV
jgi:hypothetical protein